MKKFEYIEVVQSTKTPLVDELNLYGQTGWQFVTQGVRIKSTSLDFRTGKPVQELTLVFMREVAESLPHSTREALNSGDGTYRP